MRRRCAGLRRYGCGAGSRRRRSARAAGSGPPVAQSSSSTVCSDRHRRVAADLHHAAEIAGRDDVRIDALRMCAALRSPERLGDVGLQQIVGAGRAAAEMPLRHVDAPRSRPASSKRARRRDHALAVLQRAGIVIGDAIGLAPPSPAGRARRAISVTSRVSAPMRRARPRRRADGRNPSPWCRSPTR